MNYELSLSVEGMNCNLAGFTVRVKPVGNIIF